MSYRCPLCLKPLDETQELARHCTEHPDRDDTFACVPRAMSLNIFCPVLSCRSAEEIKDGVFLRHVGCTEHNPFWDGTKIDIPGDVEEGLIPFTVEFGTGQSHAIRVQHWLLNVLRTLPRSPGAREMWFPLMLLRATAERNGSHRVGTLVELAGAQQAGKTVLAVQAMHARGYVPSNARGDVLPVDYIYSPRGGRTMGRAFQSFIETLHLNSLLERNRHEIFLPQGTPRGLRNLKVTFLKRAAGKLPAADGSVKGVFKRLGKVIWREAVSIATTDVRSPFSSPPDYWHTIVFYDRAGETYEQWMNRLEEFDKVAVVVNAAEIVRDPASSSPPADEESLRVAKDRISQAVVRKQICYLVVTQLDRVKDKIDAADWQRVQSIADDVTSVGQDRGPLGRAWSTIFPRRASESRKLLEKWLGNDAAGNRRQLKERLKDVEDIFFVWTDDLPTSLAPQACARLPSSHGLAKFVCRCLDIEWEQINRDTD